MASTDSNTVEALAGVTVQQAMAPDADPLAIFKIGAAHKVLDLQGKVEKGNGAAVLEAVAVCADGGLLMPPWLSAAFVARYRKVVDYEVASWDEAFGCSPLRGKHRDSMRKRRELVGPVTGEIYLIVLRRTAPLDKELFANVGARHGIGATLCEEIYKEGLKRYGWKSPARLVREKRGANSSLAKTSNSQGMSRGRR